MLLLHVKVASQLALPTPLESSAKGLPLARILSAGERRAKVITAPCALARATLMTARAAASN